MIRLLGKAEHGMFHALWSSFSAQSSRSATKKSRFGYRSGNRCARALFCPPLPSSDVATLLPKRVGISSSFSTSLPLPHRCNYLSFHHRNAVSPRCVPVHQACVAGGYQSADQKRKDHASYGVAPHHRRACSNSSVSFSTTPPPPTSHPLVCHFRERRGQCSRSFPILMSTWLWRAADSVESMTCGLDWFIPLKILPAVGALSFMMSTSVCGLMGERCITIRTPIKRFVSAHFTEAPCRTLPYGVLSCWVL